MYLHFVEIGPSFRKFDNLCVKDSFRPRSYLKRPNEGKTINMKYS